MSYNNPTEFSPLNDRQSASSHPARTGSTWLKREELRQNLMLEITKSVAHISDSGRVWQKLRGKLVQLGIESAIKRYGRDEKLPRRYQLLAKNGECLTLLMSDLFTRIEGITLTPPRYQKIKTFAQRLVQKDNRSIAWEKVSRLQAFIHDEITEAKGWGQCYLTDREEMRVLLSCARLHLSIIELTQHCAHDISALEQHYRSRADAEYRQPVSIPGSGTRKNRYRWRVRHMRSLLYYFPQRLRQSILTFCHPPALNFPSDSQQMILHCRRALEEYLGQPPARKP